MAIKLHITRHKEHLMPPKKKITLTVERVKSSPVVSQKHTPKKSSKRSVQKTQKDTLLAKKDAVRATKNSRVKQKKVYTSLAVGDLFPAFSLPSSEGGTVSLESLRGEKFVIYFYPKDMTSGCTTEAREFSLLAAEFAHLGYRIFGVSADSIERHLKFIEKERIVFPLLSDESKTLARACGILHPGITRSTFVVDASGHILYLYGKVTAKGHGACVYKDVSTHKTSI